VRLSVFVRYNGLIAYKDTHFCGIMAELKIIPQADAEAHVSDVFEIIL